MRLRLSRRRRLTNSFRNPVLARPGVDHGDPFVLDHLGRYHLFHSAGHDVAAYTSYDLVHWRPAGGVLDAHRPDWAQLQFWAPEVEYRDGAFEMYVTATRRGRDGLPDDDARRLGLARSADPLGPYRLQERPLLDRWAIDGHPFTDSGGGRWLFFNLRDASTGLDRVPGTATAVAALGVDGRPSGSPIPVAYPSQRWEGDRPGGFYWNEGPWALERGGRIHVMYSGGFYGDESYAIGLTSAAEPAGPYAKHPANPMLVSGRRLRGPGHHCVVRAPDGVTAYAVYHAHLGAQRERSVGIDRLDWVGGVPRIAAYADSWPSTPGERRQAVPPPAVYDPDVVAWQADGWAAGTVSVAGQLIALPRSPGLRRVRARAGPGGWAVWADGLLLRRVEGSPTGAPGLRGADVRSASLVSHLTDPGPHRLGPGDELRWGWGGQGCELCLSLRGEARIQAGVVQRELRWPHRFGLLRLRVNALDELSVRAGREGAVVADLTLTARAGGAER